MDVVVNLAGIKSKPVSHYYFFEQSPGKQQHAGSHGVIFKLIWMFELRQQVTGSLNGALQQLGEERHVEGKSAEVMFRFFNLQIDISEIGNGLKGKIGRSEEHTSEL